MPNLSRALLGLAAVALVACGRGAPAPAPPELAPSSIAIPAGKPGLIEFYADW